MKKTLYTLSAGLILAGAAQAATLQLDFAAAAQNADGTVVSTSASFLGATFDVSYTLSSVANGANPFVGSTGAAYGVGSDTDISAHYNTLEGNDGEAITFSNLTFTNFQANGSGFTIADFSDLTFSSFSIGAGGNNNDGANVTFGGSTTNQNLNSGNIGTGTFALTGFGSGSGDSLTLAVDSGQSNNRWNVNGLEVSYTTAAVPEPSSTALLGLGGLALILRRRK
ncbi:PEP-CTERM sorting domain-containing protein [Rubritalea sp.]|uniref:PEP-CTERM sorting domain-containing protein n=1 Tax=Rubritalea sp. TaxID=2109375 RepID=UPI003EF52626